MKNARRRRRRGAAGAVVEKPGMSAHRHAVPARDRRAWLVAIPLVLIVVAAFLPVLGNGLVDWDDGENFLGNPHYRGLGWPQLRWAWTTFRLGVYQPMAWMLLEAQYALFGLDPRGYHLTSLLLHAAVAVVLYALTMELLDCCRPDASPARPWARAIGAGLAAALFAVHPLRVESVAWASCQPYLPCALFAMLTVLAYLRAVGSGPVPRRGWLAGSLFCYAAALLSHAPAVGLPAVLLILDAYPLRRLGGGPGRWIGPSARKVWLEKVPFVVIGLAFMGLAVAAKAETRTIVPLANEGVGSRVAQACYGTWFYLIKTAIPTDIAALYPRPPRIDWYAPPFLASIVATAAVTAGLIFLPRRWPGLLAAWLSYLALLAPSSGLVRIGSYIAADRYSYLPLMAFVVPIAAGLGLAWTTPRRTRAAAVATAGVALAAIVGLGLRTRDQCRIWRTSETLWTHALAHGGESSMAHLGLGSVRYRQSRLEEAAAHYLEAIRLDPGSAGAHHGMGAVRSLQGRPEEAAAEFVEAIRLDPSSAPSHSGLASIRARQGRYEEAIARLDEAIRLDPDHADSYNDRAMILASCPEARYRDGREAVAAAIRACELAGWDRPEYLDTLAAAYAEAGDFAAAVARQEQAIGLLPDGPRKDGYRSRLALYRAGRPFHAPAPAAGSP